jgi:hypothetical protein
LIYSGLKLSRIHGLPGQNSIGTNPSKWSIFNRRQHPIITKGKTEQQVKRLMLNPKKPEAAKKALAEVRKLMKRQPFA